MLAYIHIFVLLSLCMCASANGGWTQWTNWTTCSKTCGCGSQYRTRECHSIPKALDGPGCNGSTFSVRSCNNVPCTMWGEWSTFSPCTCSCGGGIKAQSRVCNRIPKALGGPGCVGNNTRIVKCNPHRCTGACSKAPAFTKTLPDSSFSASTTYHSNYAPKRGRLNSASSWCPKTRSNLPNDYLEIDLKALYAVCGVATQGHPTQPKHWTTKYKLQLSLNGTTWNFYQENGAAKEFPGNNDKNTVMKHVLRDGKVARYLRFVPTATPDWPCFRVEVYGYKL